MAVNQVGYALSGSGTVFSGDSDPELVKESIPFSLKLMESVLEATPAHVPLLTSLAKNFTSYSYAFIQMEADYIEDSDMKKAREMRDRSRNLYLRARDYGLRGLDVSCKNFSKKFFENPTKAMKKLNQNDPQMRELVQWTLTSWAAAISVSKDRPDLIADLPYVEAMLDWHMAWEKYKETYPLESFLMSFEGVRTKASGGLTVNERVKIHFDNAVSITKDSLASPYVNYAENICIQTQDRQTFEELLNKVLAIDVNAYPANRLENLLMQKRARWLLSRIDDLFLPPLDDLNDLDTEISES